MPAVSAHPDSASKSITGEAWQVKPNVSWPFQSQVSDERDHGKTNIRTTDPEATCGKLTVLGSHATQVNPAVIGSRDQESDKHWNNKQTQRSYNHTNLGSKPGVAGKNINRDNSHKTHNTEKECTTEYTDQNGFIATYDKLGVKGTAQNETRIQGPVEKCLIHNTGGENFGSNKVTKKAHLLPETYGGHLRHQKDNQGSITTKTNDRISEKKSSTLRAGLSVKDIKGKGLFRSPNTTKAVDQVYQDNIPHIKSPGHSFNSSNPNKSTPEPGTSPRNRSSIITTLSPQRVFHKRNYVESESEKNSVTTPSARKPLLGTASLHHSGTSISISQTTSNQMPALESQFNASKALQDCEELTTWANEVLKWGNSGTSVSDLRKSVADGTTLATLIHLLSGEKVPGVASSGVLTRGQKADNLKQCVDCLSKQGVDVSSVVPKELTDGNLKATLMLMNSLRRRYDQPSRRETADGAVQPPQTSSRPNSAHARLPPDPSDMPPPLKPRTSSRSSDVSNLIYRRQHEAALDILPGSLSQKDDTGKVNGMPPMISTTELDSHSVSQRGVDERRPYLPAAPSRQAPPPPPRPQRNSLGDQPGLHAGPPPSTTQAWVSSNVSKPKHITNGNGEIEEAVSQTVGERLKSLLTSPGGNQPTRLPSSGQPVRHVTARTHPNLPSDDGELLLPPPRKPLDQYYGSWPGIDNKALDFVDVTQRHLPPGQSPVAHHDEEDLFTSSYVPSHPGERVKGSRGQVILDRSVRPSSTESPSPSRFNMPGQYPTYSPSAGQRATQPPPPPRYQPPPQYGSTRQSNGTPGGGTVNQAYISSPKPVPKVGGNTDLRNVCSRLYGSNQDVAVRNSQSPYTNGQGDTGTWNKYNNQSQPRVSPQGQSNSTPTSHSSSSYSHSPGSSAGQDHNREPPRPPPPSSARMAGLTSAQIPINEMSRLSLQPTNGHSYSNRPGPLPQGPHPHLPENRQQHLQHQQHEKGLANKPPPHSAHSDRTLTHDNSGAPISVRQSPRIINHNGVYSQVNRDHSHERERTQSLESKNNEKKLNNGAPELPPKRMDPSPVLPRHGANSAIRNGLAHPPSYKDTLEMQQLRPKPDQVAKAGSGAIKPNHGGQVEYDSAQGMMHQAGLMPPPGKWQGSVALNNGDLTLNGRYSPSASSRSITPPLPPLSPADTPPITPPESPSGPKYRSQISNSAGFLPDKTPDVVNSAKKGIPPSGRRKSSRRLNGGGVAVKTWDGRHKRMTSAKPATRSSSRPYSNGRTLGARSDEEDSDNFEGDSQLGSTTAASGTEVDVDEREIRVIRQQLQGLETMYHEILKLLGVDNEFSGSRRSISSASSISRTGRRSRHPHSRGGVVRSKEIKQINKRFARLESHVVTLARSVAHLSSEMRSHVTNHPDIEEIKREIKRLKELSIRGDHKAFANEWERFRGWVPSLTNPKRVNKLTQFFGQEPPLLHIFLKKLGYEKYVTNFEQERIGMIELPYMTEDRLQRIGVPMGPRLRILQEAQMCFRQENFDIYIV